MRLSNEVRTVLKGRFKAYREGASAAREGLSGRGRHRAGVQVLVPYSGAKEKGGKEDMQNLRKEPPVGRMESSSATFSSRKAGLVPVAFVTTSKNENKQKVGNRVQPQSLRESEVGERNVTADAMRG